MLSAVNFVCAKLCKNQVGSNRAPELLQDKPCLPGVWLCEPVCPAVQLVSCYPSAAAAVAADCAGASTKGGIAVQLCIPPAVYVHLPVLPLWQSVLALLPCHTRMGRPAAVTEQQARQATCMYGTVVAVVYGTLLPGTQWAPTALAHFAVALLEVAHAR